MKLTIATLFLALSVGPSLAQDAAAPGTLEVLRALEAVMEGEVESSVPVLRAAAEAGDPRAQVYYGTVFEYGDLGTVDMAEAIRWYEAAAAQGYVRAYFRLGEVFYYGAEGWAADPARARAYYQQGAGLGDVASTASLGYMMLHGEGGPKDEALGIEYLEVAVENGDPDAAVMLGYAYEKGIGVAPDHAESRRLAGIAAAQGDAVGENNLGVALMDGLGGPQDLAQGAAYLRAAMADDYARAGSNLSKNIAAHPELDPRPQSAAAHCIWARDIAGWQDNEEGDWDCVASVLAPLSVEELKAARALAETLVPAE